MGEEGVVDLTDLPPERVRLNLSRNSRRDIFGSATKTAGSQRKLSTEIGVPQPCISEYVSGTCSPTLATIWGIRKYLLDEKHEDVLCILRSPGNIRKIRAGRSPLGIISPRFPIDFNNQKGAAFAMAFLGDGHIQKTKMRAEYTNYRPELIQSVIDSSRVMGRIEYYREEKRVIFPSVVGFILHYGLGIPTGNKMECDPKAPAFLFNTSKETTAAALRQIYDDEGTVTSSAIKLRLGKWARSDQAARAPPRLLLDARILAEKLGIEICDPHISRKLKEDQIEKQVWGMHVCGRENFELFKERVGFNARSKREKLDQILAKWITWRSVARSIFYASSIVEGTGYITSKDMAIHLNIKEKSARKLISKLQKDGLITHNGNRRHRYIKHYITEKGWRFLGEVKWALKILGRQAPEWSI